MQCWTLAVLVAAFPVTASAQQSPPPAGPSFLIFRYASQSSLGMYSGYNTGPLLVVVGMLHNPRSSYQEIMAGVGRPITAANGNGVTVATALGYTNTGWYGQFYLLPSARFGALSASATVEYAGPLSVGGTRGVYVSPGNLFFDVGGGFSVGAGYYGSAEAGSLPSHAAGPAVQRAVPRGSVTLELIKGITAAKDEVRVTLRSSF
jgi:hypothetical protein